MNRKITIQVIGGVGLLVGFIFVARESAIACTRVLWNTNKLYVLGRPNNGLAGIDGAYLDRIPSRHCARRRQTRRSRTH